MRDPANGVGFSFHAKIIDATHRYADTGISNVSRDTRYSMGNSDARSHSSDYSCYFSLVVQLAMIRQSLIHVY